MVHVAVGENDLLHGGIHLLHRVEGPVDIVFTREANPDELELEFGLKLYAEGNALIAKGGAEAAFAVKLTWKRGGGQ